MKRKGQGSFEYVLLLAGILLIVVIAMVMLRGSVLGNSEENIKWSACVKDLALSSECYDDVGQFSESLSTPYDAYAACNEWYKYYTATTGTPREAACDGTARTTDIDTTGNICCTQG